MSLASSNTVPASNTVPVVPLMLGVGGMMNFVVLSAVVVGKWHGLLGWDADFARTALAIYGALILSFLGGIRWGLAINYEDQKTAQRDYIISIVPSLLAWGSLAFAAPYDLYALGGLMILLGLLDFGLTCRGVAPLWFGRLRLALSAVAGAALLIAGAF